MAQTPREQRRAAVQARRDAWAAKIVAKAIKKEQSQQAAKRK